MSPKKPEENARERIDANLAAAGWQVQDREDMNLAAGRGVAVRKFKMADGHGFADYLLFVDGHAVGALEGKPEGHTLAGVESQARKYSEGLPPELEAPTRPLPFLYLSNGVEIRFSNRLDPDPRSRPVFAPHQPDTLAEWLRADPLDAWTRAWRRTLDVLSDSQSIEQNVNETSGACPACASPSSSGPSRASWSIKIRTTSPPPSSLIASAPSAPPPSRPPGPAAPPASNPPAPGPGDTGVGRDHGTFSRCRRC